MNQYRYQVQHVGCKSIEIVACWTDKDDNDCDDEIKQFAHRCHITPLGQREAYIQPCSIALNEASSQYEIVKRRF